jgi:transposase
VGEKVRWPQLKKKRSARAALSSSSTKADNWKLLSATAGITWRNFYFRLYRGTIRTAQVLDFLNHLLRHLPGKLLVIWDCLPQHRACLVREFVAAQGRRLMTEYLPSHAPEHNPVEYLWGYWKHHALANFCPDDLTELGFFGRLALRRMRRRPALCDPSWQQS